MPRAPAKFTQADVARVLRAIHQTGVQMDVLIEPDGKIRLAQPNAASVDRPKGKGPKPKSWTS